MCIRDRITVVDDPDELVEQIAWCDQEKCYLSDQGLLSYPKRNGGGVIIEAGPNNNSRDELL